MDLMLYGAIPFNYPEGSLADRRRRKNGRVDEMVMMQVATEAADAIQFVLGPRHRSSSFSSPSPSYRIPDMNTKCPPNTPINKFTFDFEQTANDADCSESDTTTDDEGFLKAICKNENMTRKRRRLCSFSNSSPVTRRVPNKKKIDETEARKILLTTSKKDCMKQKPPPFQKDVADSSIVSRLSFYSEVQEAIDNNNEKLPEEKWKKLGKSLRAIADKFGNKQGTSKEMPTDLLPNGVWSAVISYVFWKFIRGWK